MKRHAKQPEPVFGIVDYAGYAVDLAGRKIVENPAVVGSSVAFAVVMFFVGSNALFYQPFAHEDALFSTRSMENYAAPDLPPPLATISRVKNKNVAEGAKSSPAQIVRQRDLELIDIQTALARLNIYDGSIDGVAGPKTRAAIEKFQVQAGLEPTGQVDPLFIDAIRTASIPAEKMPVPARRNAGVGKAETEEEALPVSDREMSSDDVRKLQAGLKAFGNDLIEIDGKIGSKTKEAILEFQRLFKLAETGTANQETLLKLQELGLVSG